MRSAVEEREDEREFGNSSVVRNLVWVRDSEREREWESERGSNQSWEQLRTQGSSRKWPVARRLLRFAECFAFFRFSGAVKTLDSADLCPSSFRMVECSGLEHLGQMLKQLQCKSLNIFSLIGTECKWKQSQIKKKKNHRLIMVTVNRRKKSAVDLIDRQRWSSVTSNFDYNLLVKRKNREIEKQQKNINIFAINIL